MKRVELVFEELGFGFCRHSVLLLKGRCPLDPIRRFMVKVIRCVDCSMMTMGCSLHWNGCLIIFRSVFAKSREDQRFTSRRRMT